MATSNLRLPEQNSVNLVGRVVRDPEVKSIRTGSSVCNFSVALNSRYKDKVTGAWKDGEPTYVQIVVWGDSGVRCGERLRKGSPVHVEGRLQSRSWETKEGEKRSSLEVVAKRVQFLSFEGGDKQGQSSDSDDSKQGSAPAEVADDEEIPF